MDQLTIIDRIFADKPPFHRIETEVSTPRFATHRSALPASELAGFENLKGRQHWGISPELGRALIGLIKPGMTTLETGSGASTLIFALGEASHTSVTPDSTEVSEIRKYARQTNIDLSRVTFAVESSESYLPTASGDLDIVLIDGKHTFPWPILDWHHTAERLRVGGLMMLDDTQLRPVAILRDFLAADTVRWNFHGVIGGRTAVFRKVAGPIHDVAWHEHPWTALWKEPRKPLHKRIVGRLLRSFRPDENRDFR
jgi:predicted O-methyltransferase YrrM